MADVSVELTGPMRPSDYLLDTFGMPELFRLGTPTPPSLGDAPSLTIPRFVAMTIFEVNIASPQKGLLMGVLRRTLQARASYEAAALALAEQLDPPDVSLRLGPIFRALSHYEDCVASTDLALAMLGSVTQHRWFRKQDGSSFERLRGLHNTIKHADERFRDGEVPASATVPMWIVTDGLRSQRGQLLFDELADIISMLSREIEGLLRLPAMTRERTNPS